MLTFETDLSGDGDFNLPNEALESTLGIAPSGLQFCFDRRQFLNKYFDEDAFILDRLKMGVPLETLHDSLLQYFNILKNSLVELINQDYADFVNLSTNLIGLDKIIDNLHVPLVGVKDSVVTVLRDIQTSKAEFERSLRERRELREKKEIIHNLITVSACTSRLERWMASPASTKPLDSLENYGISEDANSVVTSICVGATDSQISPITTKTHSSEQYSSQDEARIDRVAQEYTKLQYFARKCGDHPFVENLKPRIQSITANLRDQLEESLRAGFDQCHAIHKKQPLNSSSGHSEAVQKVGASLRQILSTYLSIDKLSDATNFYRRHVLRPRLVKVGKLALVFGSSIVQSSVVEAYILKNMSGRGFVRSFSRAIFALTRAQRFENALKGHLSLVSTVQNTILSTLLELTKSPNIDYAAEIFAPCSELISSHVDPFSASSELQKRYSDAENLLDSECSLFKQFIFKRSQRSYEPLSEFDPLVDGFFPECVEVLFQQLPEIFSAGNPEKFFELYKTSLEFLDQVETRTDSLKQVKKLRQHASYAAFLAKWSLHVYFQLRFQQASQVISVVLQQPDRICETSLHNCRLQITEVILTQIEWCWSDRVFLEPLRHRFWKLTLQLLNVFAHALSEAQPSSDAEVGLGATGLKSLFLLFIDAHRVLKWIDEGNLEQPVLQRLSPAEEEEEAEKRVSSERSVWLKECIDDTRDRIYSALDTVKMTVRNTFQMCMHGLVRQVQDLPRQYRRTNRDWPASASNYLLAINRRLTDLVSEVESIFDAEDAASLPGAVCSETWTLIDELILKTTKAFRVQTDELVASVKKVEDSLRRLRVARSGGTSVSSSRTDDDKIRHQIQIDINSYTHNLMNLKQLSKKSLEANLDLFPADLHV